MFAFVFFDLVADTCSLTGEPEVSDRIILALGLGSSEFIPTSTPPSGPTGQPGTTPLGPSGPSNSPPPTGPPGSCHGKRSLNYNFNDDIHDDIINDDPNNQYLLCPPAPAPTTPPPPPLITVPRPGSLPPGSIRPGPLGGGPLGKRSPAGLDGDRSRRHAGQICRHFTVPRQQGILTTDYLSFETYMPYTLTVGRRSVRDELKGVKMNRRQSANEPEPLPVDPIPFNVGEHGSRYRRSHRDNCREQYILFVLDASGSIGKQWFDRVTELLAELVLYFCKPIRVATMTFDDRFFAEFCFDEYDNSSSGRVGASAAINATDYRRHGRLTHTGGAAKCVCEYMLTDTCGFPVDAGCTDVIFFTDGRANDPILDICTEIDCLHDSRDVDTFAIGVGNYNDLSLGCYGKNGLQLDEYHLFDFANFATLEREFEIVIQKLNDTAHNGGDYECASTRVDPRER